MAEAAAAADIARRATERLRLPPHSVEAEQSLLGGLMLDERAWDQIAAVVAAEDLYRADHRLIFDAVAALAERREHPRLCAHHSRPRDAAEADRDRRRYRRERVRDGRAVRFRHRGPRG